ncbi:lamin tail domain-containing protein [Chloroflexi bacterium TSY]|nr:lamin tail domain-containing protein [Chloroflexi bacterium TSY]
MHEKDKSAKSSVSLRSKQSQAHTPKTLRGSSLVWITSLLLFSGILLSLLVGGINSSAIAQSTHPIGINATSEISNQDVLDLRLNEIMADNESSLADPDDPNPEPRFEDWFEIYNTGNTSVNLEGLYLTDNLTETTKHHITRTLIISPQGYLIFWADNDPEQGPNHVSFRLRQNGEALALIAADGLTVIDKHEFGDQQADVSLGRLPDGTGEWVQLPSYTPGKANQFAPLISQVTHQPPAPNVGQFVNVTAVVTDDISVENVGWFKIRFTLLIYRQRSI